MPGGAETRLGPVASLGAFLGAFEARTARDPQPASPSWVLRGSGQVDTSGRFIRRRWSRVALQAVFSAIHGPAIPCVICLFSYSNSLITFLCTSVTTQFQTHATVAPNSVKIQLRNCFLLIWGDIGSLHDLSMTNNFGRKRLKALTALSRDLDFSWCDHLMSSC